ncbi:MmpS family protein [Micromonospora yasonensis]|uniref:MmpS family protein n=1 Tax=Micromonospora yasonensis TaxID=1128667 RepID=UPI002230BB4B|nr:MmpS family protein [Micromonospora yasonensis]MCW3841714.1 MmpS family protein [Micromonospora yasonensis]
MNPTDRTPPWAPPDPPRQVPPDPPPLAEDVPALLAADAVAEGRWQHARLSTVLLAGVAAVALAAFGCLGMVLLPLTRPDRPYGDDRAARQPPAEAPAADPDPTATPPSAPPPSPSRSPASTPSNGPGRHTVAYAVTGQGPADIQYRDADGELIQLDRVSLPWRRTIRTDRPTLAWVQAGKADDKGGRTINCALAIDGGQPITESVGPGGWRCGCGG